jgi:hypothetical protein
MIKDSKKRGGKIYLLERKELGTILRPRKRVDGISMVLGEGGKSFW